MVSEDLLALTYENHPSLFLIGTTLFFSYTFNKFIATKPWVNNKIKVVHSVIKSDRESNEKSIMALRLNQEDIQKNVNDLTKASRDVAKSTAVLQATVETHWNLQKREK